MFKILSQPYPYPENSHLKRLSWCLFEGTFIALFLIIFQPFGTSEWQHPHKTLFLLGYGGIVVLAGLIIRFLLPAFFPNYYNEKNWTVGREIACTLLLLFLITIGNVLYANILGLGDNFFGQFWSMIVFVFILGAFPIAFGILANYIYQLKKYSRSIEITTPKTISSQEPIKLLAENEKDFLELLPHELLYIESSDNYSTIVFEKQQNIQKELLRSSLSRLETQLGAMPKFVRCHRSYIVNLNRVKRVSGNAQGYKFHLTAPEIVVPVARKYASLVEDLR